MIRSKEDRIEYLNSAILFVVLVFFLTCGFSTLHEQPCHHKAQPQEQISELHPNTVAVYFYFQHPSFQKSQISSLIDKMNFKIFNVHFKVLADNSTEQQKIIALQKVKLGIKPLVTQRFYHPYLCIDSEDLPILS